MTIIGLINTHPSQVIDIVRLLLNNSANLTFHTDKFVTPLHIAAHYDNQQLIEVFIQFGLDLKKYGEFINARTIDGFTPFCINVGLLVITMYVPGCSQLAQMLILVI